MNETERTQEAHVVLFDVVICHSSHVFVWRCKVEEQTECHTEAMTSQLVFILHIYLPETFEGNAMVFLYCNYGRMSRESLTTETYVFGGWKFLCITQLIQNQRNFDKRGKIQVKELIKFNFKAFFVTMKFNIYKTTARSFRNLQMFETSLNSQMPICGLHQNSNPKIERF